VDNVRPRGRYVRRQLFEHSVDFDGDVIGVERLDTNSALRCAPTTSGCSGTSGWTMTRNYRPSDNSSPATTSHISWREKPPLTCVRTFFTAIEIEDSQFKDIERVVDVDFWGVVNGHQGLFAPPH